MTTADEATALGNAIDERFDLTATEMIALRMRVAALEVIPTDPEPVPVRERIPAQVFVDQPGLVLESKFWTGDDGAFRGVKLIRCDGAIIRDCVGTKSGYSGLWIDNCKDVLIEDCEFSSNGRIKVGAGASGRVGHGIHFSGDSSGKVISTSCYLNFEDGCQLASNMTGLVEFQDCDFSFNLENSFDGKGGSAIIRGGTLHSAADRHEAILIHNKFTSLECVGVELESESFKAFINIGAGQVVFEDCLFTTSPPRANKYFLIGKQLLGAEVLPNLMDGPLTIRDSKTV